MIRLVFLLGFIISFSASAATDSIVTFKFNFDKQDNFKVSYADYPKGEDVFYELESKNGAKLPAEIRTNSFGLKIRGNNHSDDLFMYAYKKITGLKPNTLYQASFSLEFASNAYIDSSGIGGSPGSSVYVKIGAVAEKPKRYVDDSGLYRMVLDKGNQMSDGKDMLLIGTYGVDTHDFIYRLKTLPYLPDSEMQDKLEHYTVTSNDKGEVWVIFGTDSGFEGPTEIYYTNLVASFKLI